MTDENKEALHKGRLYLWFGAACLIASAILVPIRSSYVPLLHHQVPGTLLCHTMLALGLAWVTAGNVVMQTQRQRWLPVPFIAAYGFVLAREWAILLS